MVALEHLFELQPRAKKIFGFEKGEDVGKKSAAIHANAFAGLFDTVFQMLGPDVEFLQEILTQVGRRQYVDGRASVAISIHGASTHLFIGNVPNDKRGNKFTK